MENTEALALLRHHAGLIRYWSVTSCDPVAVAEQKAQLRKSADRLLALAYEIAPPPPEEAPKSAVPAKRRKATERKRRKR